MAAPDRVHEDPRGLSLSSDSAATALLPRLRPENIRVVPLTNVRQMGSIKAEDARGFVLNIRSAGPYLHMHAGRTMVVHVSSTVFGTADFNALMDDLALVKMLGVKLVVVLGIREQVEERLGARGRRVAFSTGYEAIDKETLQIVKETTGAARTEVEARLSRSQTAAGGTKGVSVIGGNLFFSVKPIGVHNGVDYGYRGEVRKVDAKALQSRLDMGDLVLLTPLGYAASGEAYNLCSERLAAEVAAALQTKKLLFVTDGHSFISAPESAQGAAPSSAPSSSAPSSSTQGGHTKPQPWSRRVQAGEGDLVQCMRLSDAKLLMAHHDELEASKRLAADPRMPTRRDLHTERLVHLVRVSVSALERGVPRAHLVPPSSGDLLRELYTTDGAGTLISRNLYDGIRPATDADVGALWALIEPLQEQGILVKRTLDEIQAKIEHTYVFTRDGNVVACGMLVPFGPRHAEISCLAVSPDYRGGKRGDAMLTYLERVAVGRGIHEVFLLSTRSLEFFAERGFAEVGPGSLPPERHYDRSRGSRVYAKHVRNTRDLDMEELFWD